MSGMWTLEKLIEWENALRSGEYPMAFGSLATSYSENVQGSKDNTTVGYCCLGVACEVMKLRSDRSVASFDWHYYGPKDLDGDQDYSNVSLPRGAWLPFGGGASGDLYLDTETQLFPVTDQREGWTVSLAACNDTREFTQDQLADLVHFFFVVPATPDGPQRAYNEAVAVDMYANV